MLDMGEIPHPELSHWMHERIPIPIETREARFARWKTQPRYIQAIDAFLSRLLIKGRLLSKTTRIFTYWFVAKIAYFNLKLYNRIKVFGKENIPKTGCIFIVNHPGQLDPLILIASSPYFVSGLVAWGNGWFMDMLEHMYGLLSLRRNSMHEIVERIIRNFLLKNRFFAIWPEGHPTYKQEVEDGHSSIVRVYAVLNAKKDRVPFVPVLLRGAQCFRIREKSWKAKNPTLRKTNPVEVHYSKPIFIDRSWLELPEKGGKSPREIIDFVMHKLADMQKQKTLDRKSVV